MTLICCQCGFKTSPFPVYTFGIFVRLLLVDSVTCMILTSCRLSDGNSNGGVGLISGTIVVQITPEKNIH